MKIIFLLILLTNLLYFINGLLYRLPKTTIPSFYNLKIQPNIENNTFSGEVLIQINVKNLICKIYLHSLDLNIDSIYLDQHLTNFKIHKQYELIEIIPIESEKIAPGHHLLFIKYSGSLQSGKGFFRANYTLTKQSNLILVTDFQATDARRAFPCFDEPAFKAVFQVTLIVPKNLKALSNQPEYEVFKKEPGLMVYKFKKTLKMSSYLLAFAVTDYNVGQNEMYKNLRVFSQNTNGNNSEIPLKYVFKSMKFFEQYLNLSDVQPKVDMIEFDRVVAGTENWGMITLRQGLLSYDINVYDEFQIGVTLAHEMAHSWFGNRVTNDWWNDIWLQEGIAVYLTTKAQQEFFPKENALSQFVSSFDSVYELDRSINSTAIVRFVEKPSEIKQQFNDITYTKSAAILGMLEMIISEELFKKTLQTYILKFSYKTATTEDFIQLIEDYNPHLRSFMETYLYQNRYPIIEVEENSENYILTQKSCAYQNKTEFSIFGYKWTIPINYITDLTSTQPKLIWFDRDMEKLIIKRGNESWIKFNHHQIGFYQILYSDSIWEKFYNSIEQNTMPRKTATNILNEAISLHASNLISCKHPIKFLIQLLTHKYHMGNFIYTFTYNLLNNHFHELQPKAYNKYMDYIEKIWLEAGIPARKIEYFKAYVNLTMKNDVTAREITPEIQQQMENCAEWIMKTL